MTKTVVASADVRLTTIVSPHWESAIPRVLEVIRGREHWRQYLGFY